MPQDIIGYRNREELINYTRLRLGEGMVDVELDREHYDMAIDNAMNLYNEYIKEIDERKGQGLHPKPIDSADLLSEIIAQIKDTNNPNRKDCLNFFIYNNVKELVIQTNKFAIILKT